MSEEGEESPPLSTAGTRLDLTDTFRACAAGLSLREPFLCDKAVFSLHDAMAASQLMDRKMDSCDIAAPLASPLLKDRHAADKILFPRPAPTGIADEFTVLDWEELSMEQTAAILIEILIRLVALLNGASVGESTFTCLYGHKAVLLDMRERLIGNAEDFNQAFKALNLKENDEKNGEVTVSQYVVFAAAFCLVETTEIFRGIVNNADVYEEEDFASNTFGMSFAHVSDNPSRGYIATALELLCKAPTSPHREVAHHVLGFMSPFLYVCTTMGKLTRQKMIKVVQDLQQKVHRAVSHLKELEASLNMEWCQKAPVYERVAVKAFDSYVNRPLVGNAPVRKIFFLEPPAALLSLRTITEEIDWAVCRLLLEGNSLGRIVRILDRVSISEVNILSRSLIVLNLYFDERLLGQYAMRDLVVSHMKQWQYLPDDLIANEHAVLFLNRLAKPVYDTLKLRASNRNRQRIYMEAVMFQDWTSLQNEANLVDTHYRQERQLENTTPPFFGYYVVVCLSRLMDLHLQTAIEMGLFCGHEQLCSAYWYRDFLLAALEQNLTNMKRGKDLYLKQAAAAAAKPEAKGKKKKNAKAKNQNNGPIKKSAEDFEDEVELKLIDLKRKLCRGLVRFIVCLRKGGYVTTPSFEFTTPRKQFEKRFEPFLAIRHPPFLSYDDYESGADSSGIPAEAMLQATAELFQAAKVAAESILHDLKEIVPYYTPVMEDQVRALLKVSVGNAVYLMKLRQHYGKREKLQVDYDFDVHEEFCTIKISA
eukprot:scaffold2897_cov178-Amphora_coffeaeformis.AAC.22